MRKTSPSPVRRPWPRFVLGVCLLTVGALVIACGGTNASIKPQPSLTTIDYSPLPTLAVFSPLASLAPQASTVAPSWPVGWDTSFCTAFADFTVAHQLVIDIERAIADKSTSDARGLANELAQAAPVTTKEVTALKDWEPAAQLKTDLINMLSLDTQAASSYRSYFNDNVKSALKQARQYRTQVRKAIDPANMQLQLLASTGLTCPGQDLKLETF